MPHILTVTLNPAVDLFTEVHEVTAVHKLRCEAPQIHPGGGGINVARVLQRLGCDALALFPAGAATGQRLVQMLEAEQVPCHAVPIANETRESFTVHETRSGRDYRFVLPGPTLAQTEWETCLRYAADLMPAPQWLVLSGSLPPGVPAKLINRFAQLARERGMHMVLDGSGPALAAGLAEGVYLVKPSLRELREQTDEPLATEADWLRVARALVHQGRAQMVALSLGEQGALLVSKDQALRAPSLPVAVASTIGAGDSFLAGLVWALSQGSDLAQALRHATAAGAAALLQPGTALTQASDMQRLFAQTQATPLKPLEDSA